MKKLFTFIIILLLMFSFAASAYADSETDIFNELKAMGFENSYVAIENGSLLIRFETPAIPANFSDILLTVAIKGYEKYPSAEAIAVEAYMNNSPAVGAVVRGEDIGLWKKGALTDNDLYDRAEFMDLRSEQNEIRDDLAGFNAYVDKIDITENDINVVIHYFGKEDDFLNDFAAMAFFVVQDAPYIDKISFTYVPHGEGKYVTVNTDKNAVLSLYDGSLSQDDFIKSLSVKESANLPRGSSSIINFIKGIIGKIPKGNSLLAQSSSKSQNTGTEAIAGGILFLLFIIFLSLARNRKKRIAYITKTKRISLSRFPNKRKIYGKFVGAVQAANPLQAPFSKKNVVMYQAELQELRKDTADEDQSKNWKTIWKDKKITDFNIKELGGTEGMLIKEKGTIPKIDLPTTFNKAIQDKNDPFIQPFIRKGLLSFISNQRFRAKERALENGKKVFFIGGILKTENGFEFTPHPRLINMISTHSEKRLTGHYKKVSFWLTFFALISLVVAAYLALLYFGII